jgi:ApaG protein
MKNAFICAKSMVMAHLKQEVSVRALVSFRPEFSDPSRHHFVFFYRITVTNHLPFEVKLMARHWEILDSNGRKTVVDGEGVVGAQPELGPGESFTYESACNLETGIGRMHGHYVMLRTATGTTFNTPIAPFKLEAPFLLN